MQRHKTIKHDIVAIIIPIITGISGFLLLYMFYPSNITLLMAGGICGGLAGNIICIRLGYVTSEKALSDTKKSIRSFFLTAVGLILGLTGTWLWWLFYGSQL